MLDIAKKYFEENNIEGFEALSANPKLLQHFFSAISWTRQFDALKFLYVERFIPEAEKIDRETNIELLKSSIGTYLNIQSTVKYETILFGYVALYHKYENFTKNLIYSLNKNFDAQIDINKIIAHHFDYNILKPEKGIGYKISWICNCVKHQDSIASERGNPPVEFINYEKNKALQIETHEFACDCDTLKALVIGIISGTSMIAHIGDLSESNLKLYSELFENLKRI